MKTYRQSSLPGLHPPATRCALLSCEPSQRSTLRSQGNAISASPLRPKMSAGQQLAVNLSESCYRRAVPPAGLAVTSTDDLTSRKGCPAPEQPPLLSRTPSAQTQHGSSGCLVLYCARISSSSDR
ncbi:hypothetical protein NHX12_001877 [Muraenolepis orangiensis]|uniref:Uncharacterized protein n=1 Tax=Muraenolepis orangiensis TaxID=630683 RepID=A0A9Q0E5F2_9TELE|nr:hypothetical protein NHX12_001877 [Muraenolepis orangiensis]